MIRSPLLTIHSIHLGLFTNPYFDLVFSGAKTIDIRLSKVKCPPFYNIGIGDLILLKKSSGSISGYTYAKKANFFMNLTSIRIKEIALYYKKELCLEPVFLTEKKHSHYGSLIWLDKIQKINPVEYNSGIRSGWIVIGTFTALKYSLKSEYNIPVLHEIVNNILNKNTEDKTC